MQKVELGNPAFLFGHCKKKHPNMPKANSPSGKNGTLPMYSMALTSKPFMIISVEVFFWLQSYNCFGELPLQISWNVPMNHFTAINRSKKKIPSPRFHILHELSKTQDDYPPFWVPNSFTPLLTVESVQGLPQLPHSPPSVAQTLHECLLS